MNPVVNGVLMPGAMAKATREQQEAYAALTKAGNSAFVTAYLELEAYAEKRFGPDIADLILDRG
jgi:hypothetical protein